MKAPKKVLQKAVRAGIQLLGDRQATESFLLSDNTDDVIRAFEERGVNGLVRGTFGKICMERKTGNKSLSPCGFEDFFSRTHKPVPAPYVLVLEQSVSRQMYVDLDDELLPTYVSVHMKRTAALISDEELSRAVLELYGVEAPMVAVSGVMQVYAEPPLPKGDPSMNGPQEREIAVEEMLLGELYLRIIQTEPVEDLPRVGPTITGQVLMGTRRTREGGGLSMWVSRPFTGDHRKDLRDMGFYLIHQLCQLRTNPERFKAHLREQNLKSMKVDQPVEEYIEKLSGALLEFGQDLDAACEAISLEKSWREIDPSLPDTHPFSGLGWI
jgi:hypothetical protein